MTPYQPQRTLGARLKRKAVSLWRAKPVDFAFARGVLSMTFDDAPANALHAGANALEAVDARGTFYLCAGYTNAHTHLGPMHTPDDVARVLAAGHEVACHTRSHRDGARDPAARTLADCTANAKDLAALGAPALTHFAYPYGETHFALKHALAQKFDTARGVNGGLNVGRVDAMHLRAQRLYGEDTWEPAKALMRAAAEHRGWAILFTHDVSENPTPWGCTPALLASALAFARETGLTIAPVRDAYAMRAR